VWVSIAGNDEVKGMMGEPDVVWSGPVVGGCLKCGGIRREDLLHVVVLGKV